jgi:aminoglycoside phosphotransferase
LTQYKINGKKYEMVNLFNCNILNSDSWEKIFQSIAVWEPIINFILEKEKLPLAKIENLKPGTNAVFKVGDYVVKIFAPKESGFNGDTDYKSEIFALSFAQSMNVSTSELIVSGEIHDKYYFPYMIMKYIDGIDFNQYTENSNDNEKYMIAQRIREITDLLNRQCEPFNGIDVVHDKNRHIRWDKYSENFRIERLKYLATHNSGEKIFVHGDLCFDNIIIDNKGVIHFIDFADSVIAPQVYEHAHLASVLFNFDKSYLRGYFDDYKVDELVNLCFDGLLIHDFGGDIVQNIFKINEITCLKDLHDKLFEIIK